MDLDNSPTTPDGGSARSIGDKSGDDTSTIRASGGSAVPRGRSIPPAGDRELSRSANADAITKETARRSVDLQVGIASAPRGGGAERNHNYLMLAAPPASSISLLIFSASSLLMPSLIGFGQDSTSSFASFKPNDVSARTTLMT